MGSSIFKTQLNLLKSFCQYSLNQKSLFFKVKNHAFFISRINECLTVIFSLFFISHVFFYFTYYCFFLVFYIIFYNKNCFFLFHKDFFYWIVYLKCFFRNVFIQEFFRGFQTILGGGWVDPPPGLGLLGGRIWARKKCPPPTLCPTTPSPQLEGTSSEVWPDFLVQHKVRGQKKCPKIGEKSARKTIFGTQKNVEIAEISVRRKFFTCYLGESGHLIFLDLLSDESPPPPDQSRTPFWSQPSVQPPTPPPLVGTEGTGCWTWGSVYGFQQPPPKY